MCFTFHVFHFSCVSHVFHFSHSYDTCVRKCFNNCNCNCICTFIIFLLSLYFKTTWLDIFSFHCFIQNSLSFHREYYCIIIAIKSGLLRRRLAKEIQSAYGFLLCRETPATAATKIHQVHQIPLRGGQRLFGTMDGRHPRGQIWQAADGELSGAGRRISARGSGLISTCQIVLRQLHCYAAESNSVQHNER